MRVKPAPGMKIRHPITRDLFDETEVFDVDPNDFFWAKLLEHRDIEPVEEFDPTKPA